MTATGMYPPGLRPIIDSSGIILIFSIHIP